MRNRQYARSHLLLFVVLQAVLLSLLPISTSHSLPPSLPQSIVQNGAYALEREGQLLHAYKADKLFIPGSTLKIATNLFALKILGPQYRFPTHFYLDEHQNLYIQGKGDPFLVSEYIKEISQHLFKKGLSRIRTVVLDTSFFTLSSPPDGSQNSHNPYDVPNGALCVNFNSLPIAISELGTISSFESQTPHLPLMEEIGKQLTKGKHRVNVNAFKANSNLSNMDRYTGELFVAFLKESGISIDGHITTGKVPDSAQLIHTSLSKKNVTDLVSENLKYSNNFITNQLLLTCAVKSGIERVTWAAASTLMKNFIIDETGIATEELYIAEGSGLSRNNRVTSLAMLKILNAFRPYAHLLPRKNGIFIKSGTLKDTYCYVGYFTNTSQLNPFVIFLNQKSNNRDQLLDLLAKEYRIQ